jgi:hypothetical protein
MFKCHLYKVSCRSVPKQRKKVSQAQEYDGDLAVVSAWIARQKRFCPIGLAGDGVQNFSGKL